MEDVAGPVRQVYCSALFFLRALVPLVFCRIHAQFCLCSDPYPCAAPTGPWLGCACVRCTNGATNTLTFMLRVENIHHVNRQSTCEAINTLTSMLHIQSNHNTLFSSRMKQSAP